MRVGILALAMVACSALTTQAQVFGGYYGMPPGGAPAYGYGYSYQAWGYSPVPFGAGSSLRWRHWSAMDPMERG